MTTTTIAKDKPVKLSDGYRHERCAKCQGTIGYAKFDAVRIDWFSAPSGDMLGVWELTHEVCHS